MLESVFNQLHHPVAVVDQFGQVIWHNSAWQGAIARADSAPPSLFEQLKSYLSADAYIDLHIVLKNALTGSGASVEIQHKDDPACSYQMSLNALQDQENHFLVQCSDLSQLRALQAQVADLTLVDKTTGLANTKCFHDFYTSQWQRSMRNSAQLALIIAEFNQPLSSLDYVADLAQVLKRTARRACDMAATLSDSQVILVLGQIDLAAANDIGAELLRELQPLLRAQLEVNVGISAAMPTLIDTPQVLLNAAVKALDFAKSSEDCALYNYSPSIILSEEHAPASNL